MTATEPQPPFGNYRSGGDSLNVVLDLRKRGQWRAL
jgi:hypothetical protein